MSDPARCLHGNGPECRECERFEQQMERSGVRDDTLRELLFDALNYAPTDALVTTQHVEELLEHLLPRIRKYVTAAKQDERERLACGLDDMQAAYSGEVQRGLRIATILIRKISEAANG